MRPLRQIDGAIHFNEVFLDDVWVPDDHVVGPVGEGWKVARTTLTAERTAIGGGGMTRFDEILDLARRTGATNDPHLRQELARLTPARSCSAGSCTGCAPRRPRAARRAQRRRCSSS